MIVNRSSLAYYAFTSSQPIPTYSISKRLIIIWVILDLILLCLGITFAALAVTWMNADPVQNMILAEQDLFAGLALGSIFIATFLLSLPALLQSLALSPEKKFPTSPLVFLILVLAVDQLCVIAAGAIVWWRTLQERAEFFVYWEQDNGGLDTILQNKFNCCGYYNPCPAQPGVAALPVCVDPVQNYADNILNITFTFMFATSSIVLLLLLCSACLISELKVLDRFRRIDIKRGLHSFA